jgi:NAD(P)-dependent dehydrogenase (short-subunit alcohol dehydrogenase family)
LDLGVRGKGFLILGGTAGIGLAAARALAEDGASLVLVGRDPDKASEAAAALGGAARSVHAFASHLDRPGEAERIVAQAAATLGGLRGMAITTGLGPRGQRDLRSASDEDWEATFRDVLLATASACRAVVPVLAAAGGGAIVTTAAYSVRAPKPRQAPYAALKAAVVTLTKTIAKAHGRDGIRANCVCPGATETAVLAALRTRLAEERGWPRETALERALAEEWGMGNIALGRAGRPQELGDVIAFLLSERASYVTGALVNVDGGTDF